MEYINEESVPVSVIGIDIVEFSLSFDEYQKQKVLKLNEAIRKAIIEFNIIDEIIIPSGDGAYIIFPNKPTSVAIDVAIRISSVIHNSIYDIPIRIGINEGSAFIVKNINENVTIIGNVINMTQRIMDIGDAGHILISENSYNSIKNREKYSANATAIKGNPLYVKHNVALNIYNYTESSYGNKAEPSKNVNNIGVVGSSIGRSSLHWREYIKTENKLKIIGNSMPVFGEPHFLDSIQELIYYKNTSIKILILNPLSLATLMREKSVAYNSLSELKDTLQYVYKILIGFQERLIKKVGQEKTSLFEVRMFDAIPTFNAFLTDTIGHVSFYVEHLSGSRGPYIQCENINSKTSMYKCIDTSFNEIWHTKSVSIFRPDFEDIQKSLILKNIAYTQINVPFNYLKTRQ